MHGPDGADARPVFTVRLMGALRRLGIVRDVIRDGSRYPPIGGSVGVDPVNEATDAVDRRFPVESAHALADFHRELVEDGTISEQAAVTYGLRFLEHMLGVVWPTEDDDESDDDCD